MKYLVLIPDGMADEPIAELANRTPMEAADKPTMDMLVKKSLVGTVLNVPTAWCRKAIPPTWQSFPSTRKSIRTDVPRWRQSAWG